MNPLMNNQPAQQTPDIRQMYSQFSKNPVDFLIKSKFNIPDNVGCEPQNIVQYLLNSGQINQQTVNQAQAMYRQMCGK